MEEGTEENRKGLGGARGNTERNTALKEDRREEEEEGKEPKG